ncbi:MAG: hypothetical protein JWL73_2884 [Actinomycetia bacterium]|nr:hypothetical protein [Actinomycetes bacterium]
MGPLLETEQYERWLEELVSVARVKEANYSKQHDWQHAHDWHIRVVERANTLARFRTYMQSVVPRDVASLDSV